MKRRLTCLTKDLVSNPTPLRDRRDRLRRHGIGRTPVLLVALIGPPHLGQLWAVKGVAPKRTTTVVASPQHLEALWQAERRARLYRNQDHLLRSVPAAQKLLVAMAKRQVHLATAVTTCCGCSTNMAASNSCLPSNRR